MKMFRIFKFSLFQPFQLFQARSCSVRHPPLFLLLLVWATLLSAPVLAQTPGTQSVQWGAYKFNTGAQLDYQIRGESHGISYNAKAQITWRVQAQRYNAKFEIQMPLFFGTRTQWSEGLLSEQGVKPLVFTDRHRKTQTVTIDPESGLIKWADTNATTLPLERQHQDALSVLFQLGGLLAGMGEPLPFGSTLKLPVLMAQTNEQWTLRLDSKENLNLPYGELSSLKISRLPRSNSDKQKFTLWLSPTLGFMPVRILIEEDNQDTVDQRLTGFKPNP